MPNPTVLVVDDDEPVRDSLQALLESAGYVVATFASGQALLAGIGGHDAVCLVADIRMPEMDGMELQQEMVRREIALPVIFVTGHGDVALAVRAMKAGSFDFIEKPYDENTLLQSVERAIAASHQRASADADRAAALKQLESLTTREREVLDLLVAGRANKVVAHELDISPRTVEVHRSRVMEKLHARNLSDLVRIAIAAGPERVVGK